MTEELWVIQGSQPCIWAIPFYVVYEDDLNAVMFHAVAISGRQQKAVRVVLEQVAVEEKAMWRITRVALERIGRRVELCDPETLFVWERARVGPAPEVLKADPGKTERDEFLDSLYLTGIFESREHLTIAWKQICEHALDWMINKEKPLDMYFVRLHNCPYRANWKNVLLSRFPRLGRLIAHRLPGGQEEMANECGLLDELRCTDLMAMGHDSPTILRSVEVEMRGLWYKTVTKSEHRRLLVLGAIGYGRYVLGSIHRWGKHALKIYVQWLNLISRPSSATVESGEGGAFRLVPNNPPADVYRSCRRGYPVPVVVPNHLPTVKEASQPHYLFPKDGILPDEMPPVRPSSPDVRDRRPDLYRREQWKTEKLRMLLSDAPESRDPVQLLGSGSGA